MSGRAAISCPRCGGEMTCARVSQQEGAATYLCGYLGCRACGLMVAVVAG